MGRVYSTAFGLQSVASGVECDTFTGTVSINATGGRYGKPCLKCNPSAATGFATHKVASADTAPWWDRKYFYFESFPSSTVPILRATDNTPVDTASIRITSAGKLQLWDDSLGTQLGSDSAALALNTWYRIELNIDGTAGATGRLDGTQFATSAAALNNGQNLNTFKAGVLTSATMTVRVTDWATNDNSGTVQNSWPGNGTMAYLWPDSQGDANDWATAVGGTAGQANNFTRVDEAPTPDDATTYNETVSTGTTLKDEFGFQSSASAGIGAADTITLVQVGTRVGSDGTSTTRNLAPRLKSQAAGTTTTGSTATCNVNGWTTHTAGSPKKYQLTSYVDPQAGGPWTPALLDTAQAGYIQVTSATLARRVSTVWLLIEYIPTTPAFPFQQITQPRRVRGLLARRGRYAAPVRRQVNPPFPTIEITQPRRVRGLYQRRGKLAQVVPRQLNPPFPFAEIAAPRRLRGWLLRRGKTATPVRPQLNPPYPFAEVGQPRRIRGWLLRRGKQAVPPAAAPPPAAPAFVPHPARRRLTRLIGRLRPGRPTVPVAVEAPVPQTPRRARVVVTARRGRRLTAVLPADATRPVITAVWRPVRAVLRLFHRRRTVPPPPEQFLPLPGRRPTGAPAVWPPRGSGAQVPLPTSVPALHPPFVSGMVRHRAWWIPGRRGRTTNLIGHECSIRRPDIGLVARATGSISRPDSGTVRPDGGIVSRPDAGTISSPC